MSQINEFPKSVIDFIEPEGLTNIAGGHHSAYRGRMSIREVMVQCDAPQIEIVEPVILLIVNPFRLELNQTVAHKACSGRVGFRASYKRSSGFDFSLYQTESTHARLTRTVWDE